MVGSDSWQDFFLEQSRTRRGLHSFLTRRSSDLYYDLNSPAGRENLNLTALGKDAEVTRFRLRPGDDVSCLNLYQPRHPRIDRKSTRLNSSHGSISYAVFCLKKKKISLRKTNKPI